MNTWYQTVIQFLKEAYAELKKVTWLSRKEVLASTIVIIILVAIIAVFVGFTDLVLARILGMLL
jgi:preprotein translocase subunit SecE